MTEKDKSIESCLRGLNNYCERFRYTLLVQLSLGFRGIRVGWNSEGIRHVAQNWFAHKVVKPQGYFRRLPSGYPGSLYTSTTRFRNPFSMWTF